MRVMRLLVVALCLLVAVAVIAAPVARAAHPVTPTLAPPTDTDGDGVDDTIENAAPNGGDGNADATLDSAQANVASLPADGTYATVVTNCSQLTSVQVRTEATVADDPAYNYPYGLVRFSTPCANPNFTILVHGTTPSQDAIRYYNGTQYVTFFPATGVVTIGSGSARSMQTTITDNSDQDLDPTVGATTFIGGFAYAQPAAVDAVPALGSFGLIVLGLGIAVVAFVAMKR